MRTRAPDGDEEPLWYVPCVVRLPPYPHPPPPPPPPTLRRHEQHPLPPHPSAYFGSVHHFSPYHQREYHFMPPAIAVTRRRTSIVGDGQLRRLATPPPATQRRPHRLLPSVVDARFHIRRPSLRNSPWTQHSLDGGTVRSRTYEPTCTSSCCRHRKSSKGRSESGGSLPTSPTGDQYTQTPPDSPIFVFRRADSSSLDITAHSSSTASLQSAVDYDFDNVPTNEEHTSEGAPEEKAEDEGRCDGSHAAPSGKYRRNAESQHPQSRCCSAATAASGSSLAKVRRRRSQGHICPHHKGRPWSLEVSTLSEGDEEGDEAVDAPGTPTDPSSAQQGRSRSLTHIDTLDPTVLVKAAAAAADSKEGLSLEGLKHLSGSAEFPSQARLDVPGGGLQDSKLRRQKLTRSQVSSSEYFSVSFECLDDPGPEEFIPAAKGTSLADALSGVCSRRGIDLNSVNVFQDSIKRPLPIHSTETSRLGGKHLKIKAKDEKSPNRSVKGSISQGPSRKTSGNYKTKGNKFFSASTEDTSFASECPSHEGSLKGPSKASKQRWSNLFGNNKDNLRMGTLAETLDNYSKNGIPKLPANWLKKSTENLESEVDAAEANGATEDEEEILLLEDDWREVIGGDACATQMTEREMQQQTAIWELLTTEAAYIKTLKVVTDLFLACLLSLQTSSGILTEVDTEHLFSNIREIHSANFHFWKHHLLPMVADARKRSNARTSGHTSPALLDPKLMKDGFLKFGDIFHPYTKYCGDQSRCQQYCREKIHENEIFTAYLAWCETRKECNRLRLQDIVVKPMQRLTKYSLLLKAIQRHTENTNDVESLDQMIKAVDEFVNGVNTTLKQRQDQERLRGIIARIESYDVVETKDDEIEKLVKTYSELDLTCPMPGCNPSQRRHLLLEADLRLRDHSTSKTEVHIFLFTDMLLICKPVTKKSGGSGGGGNTGGVGGPSGGIVGVVSHGGSSSGTGTNAPERLLKVIRQPFVVDQLVVKEASSANALSFVYLNEFKVATAALTLSASEPKVIKSLNEAIQKAQDQYRKLKKKARLEEADEAVAAAMAANAAAATPSPHAPKLAALSPYDSANSSCCLCFYDDGGASTAASVGMGDGSSVLGLIPSCPRSPRCSSSRGSRLSSLAHSHRSTISSGSMEMNEASSGGGSACQSRGISVETMTDLRGSSLSSDEGSNSATAGAMSDSSAGGHLTQQLPSPAPAPPSTSTSTPSLHQIPLVPPTSPRPERRAVLSRSPTPNTLSVLVPYTSSQVTATSPSNSTPNMRTCLGGQSLPNLSSVGGGRASGTTQHHHHPSPSSMFLVPPSRSPPPPPIGVNQRGISYPPPSPPRSLRRAYAVVAPQSFRNPPLTKTRHVGSVGPPSFSIGINADTGSQGISSEEGGDGGSLPISLDIDVPVIRSVQTPSVGGNPSLQSQEREDSGVGCGDGAEGTSQNLERQEMPENTRKTPADTPSSYEMPANSRQGLVKRLGRGGERQDNRRYHTAGAIDDIKKQDGRDTVIHKRLSWNCGSNDQPTNVSQETNQLDNPPPFLVSSFESVQSSSGVSSARSSNVHLPADDEESAADDRWANPGMFSPSTIGGAFLKVLTPEFFRDITSSQKCPSPSRSKAIEDDPWVDDASGEILPPVEAVNEQVVHMASGGEGSSELGAEGTAQEGASSRPSKADLLRMKDFILTDSSIEASDV